MNSTDAQLPTGALVVAPPKRDGGPPYYEAKFRHAARQVKRRIGPAWLVPDGSGGWQPRRGRPAPGTFTEKTATRAMADLIRDFANGVEAEQVEQAKAQAVTFRQVAHKWLEWLETVKDAKPSTLRDYRSILSEPGVPHERGEGVTHGRIMRAFGDRPASDVTVREVGAFLRKLDREGLTPRNVNKHRQVVAAIYAHGMRLDTHALPLNPAAATDKRREAAPAALDYFEPHEVEALAVAAAAGAHRVNADDRDDVEAQEDAQDAALFRTLAYTGVRLGEALALRWRDVDLQGRRLTVARAVSAGVEGETKGRAVRVVPLATKAGNALARLAERGDFVSRNDYIFTNRVGDRLDGSALRRRFNAARDAAGLRAMKLHGLRHGAGSMAARATGDAVFVQAMLGHAKLATTARYLHAKDRHEDVAKLDRAFD